MANDRRKHTKRKREIIIYAVLAIVAIIFAIWYYYEFVYTVESVNTPIIIEDDEINTSNYDTDTTNNTSSVPEMILLCH